MAAHRLAALASAFALAVALAPRPCAARSPAATRFTEAFLRMDARWPNLTSHEYWLSLKQAEDAARELLPDERANDEQVVRDLKVLDVYRKCWLALQAKEKALAEFLVGQLTLQDTPDNRDGAREHFALSVAWWDEAFRLWPFMVRESVQGDALSPRGTVDKGGLVATGAMWRQLAQRHLDAVAPSRP